MCPFTSFFHNSLSVCLPQKPMAVIQAWCLYSWQFQVITISSWFKTHTFFLSNARGYVCSISRVWLCNPLDCSLPGFSFHGVFQARYWRALPFPSPGDLPNPGIELMSPALQADALTSEPPGKQEVKLGLKSSSPNSPLSVLSTILVSANLPDHDNHLLSTSGIGPRWVLRWTRQIWERPSLHRVT